MSIKKYEVLLQTADLGSFTKASEVLGYTQSAISHIVTGLEDEPGSETFDPRPVSACGLHRRERPFFPPSALSASKIKRSPVRPPSSMA